MKIYQVGGCVRDTLMGQKPRDIDWLVVGATPDEMIQNGYVRVGADFPVFLHPLTHDEYALARKERKTSAGHKGFMTEFDTSVTLEQDLSRRDLTINAMAIDPATGEIFDPYGGQSDLKAGLLRHVSEAFSEDPLRVMRLARFQARTGFSVAPETLKVCQAICASGALNELSKERICVEIRKLLDAGNAQKGMQTLLDIGALESIDPSWPSRLGEPQLAALAEACKLNLPEWSKTRLACCAGMGANASLALLESLKFPSECFKWASRMGSFCEWALSPASLSVDANVAATAMERCGASKMTPAELSDFGAGARIELESLGAGGPVLELARRALIAAPAISAVDLSFVLSGPKKEIPQRVRDAKHSAFKQAFAKTISVNSTPKLKL